MTLKTYLLNASEGVKRVYWYAWDNKGMGFFKSDTNLDYGSTAAAAAVHSLDQFEFARCQPEGNLWQCRVGAGGRRFKVVWVAGRTAKPVPAVFDRNATRWGRVTESFPAGRQILVDARPIFIEDER
jgi:hypothetical protein